MAELPCAAWVLTPVGGVVAESERETGTAAAHGFYQREAEVEIARAQVDLFAGRAPVCAGGANADLTRVDAAGGRRGDGDIRDWTHIVVVIEGIEAVGVGGPGRSGGVGEVGCGDIRNVHAVAEDKIERYSGTIG